ncbi:MAG: hypothetical protein PHV36_05710 [Elusimicrobiales bacterium]|nr:hypothetical protein [Elusimicrobiales bacterium]
MLTKGAVEDIIMQHLAGRAGVAAPAARKAPELKRKVFLSDWELRRIYIPGSKSVQVPADSIISPLSLDWLDYDGIKVVRE